MYREDAVDLCWSTLFKFNDREKTEILKNTKACKAENYNPDELINLLYFDNIRPHDENYLKACEVAALRFCLEDSDIARTFLSVEDYDKAVIQFSKKQYSTKLLQELLAKFEYLVRNRRNSGYSSDFLNEYKALFRQYAVKVYKVLQEEQVEKSFSELKKTIEKIVSGVKSKCYFVAEDDTRFREFTIKVELNDFIKKEYAYDLNHINYYNDGYSERVFKKALLDDDKFWEEHKNFRVAAFVNSVFDLNDERHAQKILKHIFDKIKSHEIGAKILENKLSLKYLFKDAVFGKIYDSTVRFFCRFEGIYNLDKIKDEACCYPYTKTERIEEKIISGKEIMDGLFKAVYHDDSHKIIGFFNGQIKGEDPYKSDGYYLGDLFIGYSSCLWYDDSDRKAVLVYCPEYFSFENIWSRIYLIAYAAKKLESNIDKCYANLFEIFYDLFKAVEKKFGLKTAFQKDNSGREKAYAALKGILNKYGLTISDKYKNDYITSLLDRKVAVLEEIERFPILEQLGDAVYGFAVAEMMYYQPNDYEPENVFKDYDKYITASVQLGISRRLGLDKLYISPLTLSCKYSGEERNKEVFVLGQGNDNEDGKFKFLADSLEMVIGTVCKDLGYQTAIDFTKRIVREQFPDIFKKEIRWENRYEEDHDQEIDREYWNRIMPAPDPYFDDYSSKRYLDGIWHALNKFMLAYSIGTDDKEARDFITYRSSGVDFGDELYGVKNLRYTNLNSAMYDYLHNGLAQFVENYSVKIKENYKNLENK